MNTNVLLGHDGRGAKTRRSIGLATVVALIAGGLALGGVAAPASAAAGPAPIEQRNSSTVTSDVLPSVQIDAGVVWTQVINGNTVYAGGTFSNARPAGAAPGTSLMPRSNILAYDINTGVATNFAPVINGTVKSLAVSPDGTRLYVGGSFNNVNGQTRYNVAAFDTATGALITTFKPAIGGSYVNAIVATNTTVYFGGLIGAAGGITRKNLAAVNSAGAILGWAPTTDLQVDAMVMAPTGDKVIVGGRFSTVNGATQRGLAALDLSSGAVLPWAAPETVKNGQGDGDGKGKAGIFALSADSSAVYGTGWVFANKYVGNLEGLFAAESGTGAIRWIADCHGDHYGVFSDGTNVYSTSHEHDCQTAGGLPQAYPAPGNLRHATAYTAAAKGTLTTSPYVNDIYADWGGYPAPAAVNWFPDWTTGTASGQGQAGWTVTGNGQYVVVGGEFPFVNGQRQQGIVRFSRTPSTGAKQAPRLSGANWTPTARSVSAGSARVAIPSNWDRDDLNLSYELWEQGGTQPVATTTGQSTFWNTPAVVLTATGLAAGSTHTYRVIAKDGDGNTATSANVSVTVSTAAASDYANTVLDDGAALLWRLGGTSGGADWAGTNDATFTGNAGTTTDDALGSEANGAATFDGAAGASTTATSPVGASFSTEVWFKTSSTTGGKLIGYGDAASGNSGSYDRHLYMTNDGRLVFGVYPGWTATVQSSASYNNDKWHHAVAQQSNQGIQLYVDGVLVGSDASVTSAQTYVGYWRLGGDNLGGWPNQPSSSTYSGSLDEFAVYGSALTAAQVSEHYSVGRGPHTAPVASIAGETAGLSTAFDGTASTASGDAAITGYSWNFGDGSTADTAIAEHKFASAGTYDVTLIVTDSVGSSSVAAHSSVTVGTATSGAGAYTQRVLADGASVVYRLGGSLGLVDWAGGNNATATAGVGSTSDDVFTGSTNGSATFSGSGAFARTTEQVAADVPFAAEVWFKTGTTSGGKLFGYGNASSGESGNYDRHLYMDNDGRLHFGTWVGFAATVETAQSFNDNQWHHVVGQIGASGTQLFVDGVLVGSNAGYNSAQGYSGYWRIGGDNLGGWPSQPSSAYFNGQLDEFAVYPRTLTPAEVDDHFAIASGIATPTAIAGVTGDDLDWNFDASASTAPAGRTITSYLWNFGDGTTDTNVTASHAYAAPGSYEVTLTVTDSGGRTGVASHTVTATAPHAAPVAAIESDASGLTVDFDGTGSTADTGSTIEGYAWDFGDGSTSTLSTPSHSYAAGGTYTVTLTVTDDSGAASSTASASVTVAHANPTASFTHETDGLSVSVDATAAASDAATLAYSWNWGDGSAASTGAEATHAYGAVGDFTVVLTVTDSLGGTAQVSHPVSVSHDDPVAAFTSTASGLSVSVDATSTTGSDAATLSYAWAFGDTTTATGATASHAYAAAGTYTVTLTVTDSLGGTDSVSKNVTVETPSAAPIARDDFARTVASGWGAALNGGNWSTATGFSVSAGTGKISMTAGQTKTSTLSTASVKDLDATLVISSDKLANGGGLHFNLLTHKSAAGDYRLKVRTVSSGAVIVALTKVVGTVETTLATRTLTGYSYTAGAKLQLRLKTVASGASTTLSAKVWASGTTEPADWFITASDAQAQLQSAGQIGVLTYLSGSTTNTPVVVSVDDLLIMGAGASAPHAAPVAVIGSSVAGLTASFSSSGSSASGGASVTAYAWTFGDGATSTEANPVHAYASAGAFPVTLTVTDSQGSTSAQATGSVTVTHAKPVAAFTSSASALTVSVNGAGSTASDAATLSYAWAFGDGATSTGQTASHPYAAAGTYPVTLTVTDSLGATSAVTQNVTVSTVSLLVSDDFERVVATGWGSAVTGGAWGTAAGFSVADGVGKITLSPGSTRRNFLPALGAVDVDATGVVSTDKVANGGGVQINYVAHNTAAGNYTLKVRISSAGVVNVSLSKVVGTTETVLVNRALTGYTYTAGAKLQLRFQTVTAGGSTTLNGKVWADGTLEPTAWTASVADAQPELQGAGQIGVLAYLAGSTTNAPVVVSVDQLQVR